MTSFRMRFLITALFIIAGFAAAPARAFAVSNLTFEKTSTSVTKDAILQVPLIVNAEETVNSADVYVNYNQNLLEYSDITNGDFFSKVQVNKLPGQIYIGGIPDGLIGKKGKGTIATLNFIARQTGTTQITYDCRGNDVNKTSKLNTDPSNPRNIIDCSSTAEQVLGVTVNGASSGGTTTNPTPIPTTVTSGGGGSTVQPINGGGTTTTIVTPVPVTPTSLPQTGAFDGTLTYLISGSFLVGVGGLMKRLAGQF